MEQRVTHGTQSLMTVGIIRGAFGLEGKVKAESTSGEYEHFSYLKEVTLRKAGTDRIYTIESAEANGVFLLLKFAGIDTPEQAKTIAGSEIVVPRDMACPLHQGEYYIEDLKGCSLVYYGEDTDGLAAKTESAGIVAGVVTDVLEGGSGDLLEVSLSESVNGLLERDGETEQKQAPKQRTVLVPFKKEFIGTVDIQRKTVCLMHLWILE